MEETKRFLKIISIWIVYILGGTLAGLVIPLLLCGIALRIIEGPDPGEFVGPGFGIMILCALGAIAGSSFGLSLAAKHHERTSIRKEV